MRQGRQIDTETSPILGKTGGNAAVRLLESVVDGFASRLADISDTGFSPLAIGPLHKALLSAALVTICSVAVPAAPKAINHGHHGPSRDLRHRVTGIVTRANGMPIGKARIEVYPAGTLSVAESISTDDAGKFSFSHGVPGASYLFMAKAQGMMSAGRTVAIPFEDAERDCRISLEPGGVILKGSVVGPKGNPMGHGEVWLQEISLFSPECIYRAEVTAGRFSVNIPKGTYRATVNCKGYAGQRDMFTLNGNAERKFNLSRMPLSPDFAVKNWMMSHIIPLKSVEPNGSLDDLRPIGNIIGDAKIVGLGEATHGTHEFFTLKHRLIEYLVEEKGFSVFIIEDDFNRTSAINDYVAGGPGDAETAIAALDVEHWKTREMIDLVRWIRNYNADPKHETKVIFRGLDVRDPREPYRLVMDAMAKFDPDGAAKLRKDGFDDAFIKVVQSKWSKAEGLDVGMINAKNMLVMVDSLKDRMPKAEFQKVRTSALLVCQAIEMAGANGIEARDRLMAKNVDIIRGEHGSAGKAILWAHNDHVGYGINVLGAVSMGEHLRKQFGDDYRVLNFAFNQGEFRAWRYPWLDRKGLMPMTVGCSPKGSVAYGLVSTGIPAGVFDYRSIPKSGPVRDWFMEPRADWMIGGGHSPMDPSYLIGLYYYAAPTKADALVYVDRTTATRPMTGYAMLAEMDMGVALSTENTNLSNGQVGKMPIGWFGRSMFGYPEKMPAIALTEDASGNRSVTIPSFGVDDPDRYAVLGQSVKADASRGKTVRLALEAKGDSGIEGKVDGSAWIRVDRAGSVATFALKPFELDPKAPWSKIIVDAEVPKDAVVVTFGITCGGHGNEHGPLVVRNISFGPNGPTETR
jgi:erythromycin esterase